VKHITGSDNTYQVLGKSAVQAFGFQGIGNAIVNKSEGQIDTGNMMKSLLQLAQTKGVSVMNGLIINKIEDDGKTVSLHTSLGWHFSVKKLLVCTNGFAKQLLPSLELMAARNQVIVTEPIPNLSLKGCFHYDKGYFYFRNIDKRILLGGGRNLDYETEKTDQFGTTPLIQMALEKLLSTIILPKQTVKIATVWSGILGLGNVKKPIIELVSPNIGVAVRMGGMGVAIGTLVGEDGAALIFKTI
jgi:glycine/D-amino acid oxidase-like deaminating enzyme